MDAAPADPLRVGSTVTRRAPEPDADTRGLAVAAVLVSALCAVTLGPFTIWLVREVLHMGCGTYPPGTEGAGTWTCADGIGYISVAAALGALWLMTSLVGALLAGLVRPALTARIGLVVLAFAGTGAVLAWFWSNTLLLVRDEHAPLSATQLWMQAVGPAAGVAASGLLVAAASLWWRGRTAATVCAAAAGLMVVAIVLQPGLGFSLLPVAGLLAAASARSWRPGMPRRDRTAAASADSSSAG